MGSDLTAWSWFERIITRGGSRRLPEWEMRFPGFTYRLWRISDVDVDDMGFRGCWEVRTNGKPEVHTARSKNDAERQLRQRIMDDLGPLVAGLGRFVERDRDWCYACGQSFPTT